MFSIANKRCLTKLYNVGNDTYISKYNNQIVKLRTFTKINGEIYDKSNNPNTRLFYSYYKGYMTTAAISQKLKKLDKINSDVLKFRTVCITVVVFMIFR